MKLKDRGPLAISEDFNSLTRKNKKLKVLLKRIEWSAWSPAGNYCPCCQHYKDGVKWGPMKAKPGHADDCELDKAINL